MTTSNPSSNPASTNPLPAKGAAANKAASPAAVGAPSGVVTPLASAALGAPADGSFANGGFSSAGSPLLPTDPRQSHAERNRRIKIGGAAAALLIAAIAGWFLLRPKPTAATLAFTLAADPEPPVNPPAAHEWLKVNPTDAPSGQMSLAKSLEALARAAGNVSDQPAKNSAAGRADRWEIRFPFGDTIDSYARQLDALGIELGVIGNDEIIRYAAGFKRAKPNSREAQGAEEQRMYMTWHTGAMRDLDATLLARAGISSSGRIVAQFYPPQLEAQLSELEKDFAGKHDVADVRHTIFGFTAAGDTLEVVEQEYVSGEIKTPPPVAAPVFGKPKPAEKPAVIPPPKIKTRDGRSVVVPHP